MNPDEHGLMRRAKAAMHLDCSVDTLDRHFLVPDAPQPIPGKIRFIRFPWKYANGLSPIRCRATDVLAIARP